MILHDLDRGGVNERRVLGWRDRIIRATRIGQRHNVRPEHFWPVFGEPCEDWKMIQRGVQRANSGWVFK